MNLWRAVKGFEGLYWANPHRDIRNSKHRILSKIKRNGIEFVELHGNGQREIIPVSTIMLDTFPEIFKEE